MNSERDKNITWDRIMAVTAGLIVAVSICCSQMGPELLDNIARGIRNSGLLPLNPKAKAGLVIPTIGCGRVLDVITDPNAQVDYEYPPLPGGVGVMHQTQISVPGKDIVGKDSMVDGNGGIEIITDGGILQPVVGNIEVIDDKLGDVVIVRVDAIPSNAMETTRTHLCGRDIPFRN